MGRYEFPDTFEPFGAWTPEHAAARVYGGKAGDYIVTGPHDRVRRYITVYRVTGGFVGDIYLAD